MVILDSTAFAGGDELGTIAVDLRTRVIPSNHNVFVARPGEESRLFGDFYAQEAIGPDLPGLGLKRGVKLSEQEDSLDARVQRSIRLRTWHRSADKDEVPEPDRKLSAYASKGNVRSMAQYLTTLSGYFERAAKGDLAIIVPKPWGMDAVIAEFLDNPTDIVEIPIERLYGKDRLSGRRFRILAEIPKRKLPLHVHEINEKPNVFVLLEKSSRPEIYNRAFGSFVLDGEISTQFNVTTNDYKLDDDILLSAFFKFVALNTVNISIKNGNKIVDVTSAAFQDLGEFSPDLRSNVNSPGFLQYRSKNIIPLVASALFALAVTVGPEAHAAAVGQTVTIGNSRAPSGDQCTATVAESVMTQLRLMELDQWAQACVMARKIHDRAGMKGTAVVKMPASKVEKK